MDPPELAERLGALEDALAALVERVEQVEGSLRRSMAEEVQGAAADIRHTVSELGRRLALDLPQILARHRDAIVADLLPMAEPEPTAEPAPAAAPSQWDNPPETEHDDDASESSGGGGSEEGGSGDGAGAAAKSPTAGGTETGAYSSTAPGRRRKAHLLRRRDS
ncbi:MAG: hypothetical protein ACRD0Q_05445 [Acidimicrobiales bacterium]